ncbi:hypothetical protein JCM19238_3509 [Vibrio ponticus]|nr:hypothetical protein JCM19238_3509 [Vibrio ponticus]
MTRKTNNKNTEPQDSGGEVDVNKDVESLKETLPAHKIEQEGKALKLSLNRPTMCFMRLDVIRLTTNCMFVWLAMRVVGYTVKNG